MLSKLQHSFFEKNFPIKTHRADPQRLAAWQRYDMDVIHASTHSLKYYFKIGTQKTATVNIPGASTGFHIYAMDWSPGKIEAFVDGNSYSISTFDKAGRADGSEAWHFDQEFHFLFNIAVGGS